MAFGGTSDADERDNSACDDASDARSAPTPPVPPQPTLDGAPDEASTISTLTPSTRPARDPSLRSQASDRSAQSNVTMWEFFDEVEGWGDYDGELDAEGRRRGYGLMIWDNGGSYEGDWLDDKPHGEGTKTWPKGSRYSGDWKEGLRDGRGEMTHADGSGYEGGWRGGVQHGEGKWRSAAGSVYEGEWEDGRGALLMPLRASAPAVPEPAAAVEGASDQDPPLPISLLAISRPRSPGGSPGGHSRMEIGEPGRERRWSWPNLKETPWWVPLSALRRERLGTQPRWGNDDQTMVTNVYTDVQGSTSLWESCPSDMMKATIIHDMIVRQCYTDHSGYEITAKGGSFNLAFQFPVDALAFALQAQLKLYEADWPERILNHPDGKDEPALKFRGFRVRFGIHHGPTNMKLYEMTGRTIYTGEGVEIAKAVEGMCHGGQILTTTETWKAVSGMAERYLGRPQILDCGEHLLFETKNANPANRGGGYTTTRYIRRIMQLVPSELAFDFFKARGRREVKSEDGMMGFEIKDAGTVKGRLFPPLTSMRQLTTCFLNAPYANGRVTICFVYTVGLNGDLEHRAASLGVMAKYLRKKLLLLNPPGYECWENNGRWMLAFDRMANAVTFGLLEDPRAGIIPRGNMLKVGIVSGPFTSMGPHKTTGMADYYGPIVNRAEYVASSCEPGQVCVGLPTSNGMIDRPDLGPMVNVRLQGIKKLKGTIVEMAIFDISRRRIAATYETRDFFPGLARDPPAN